MPGKRQAKRKASMPRTIGMVIFRILAIGVWIFALLIFVGGLSTDFLTCTIIALIIAFVGWMLWVVGDMIHDPEKIRAEQRAARAAKDPSIVLDEDNEHERKRAANGHWDGRANHGHAQPNDETSPALAGVEVEDGEALASAHRETGQSSTLARTISPSPIIIPPKTLSVSATRETETVSGSYPATIYVYDPRPILKLKEGRAEKISVVTRPITLKSRLNGRQWRSGVDDGYAVEYKGKPFGVLFNHIAVIHIRTIRDILPRLMRGGGFLLKNPNGFSIDRLSPHALWFARCFTSRAARRFFWLRPGCSGRRSRPGRAEPRTAGTSIP